MNTHVPQAPELVAVPWPAGRAGVTRLGDAGMDAVCSGPDRLRIVRASAGGTASSGPEGHLVQPGTCRALTELKRLRFPHETVTWHVVLEAQ